MTELVVAGCDLCGGSGWQVQDEGLRAHPCQCQLRERKKLRVSSAALPKRYTHCTLATFNERGNISLVKARRRVGELVDLWPGIDRGLLLMGSCGTGKTHLAVALLQEIISQGKPGRLLFTNFQDLVQEIHASFSDDDAPSKSEILEP